MNFDIVIYSFLNVYSNPYPKILYFKLSNSKFARDLLFVPKPKSQTQLLKKLKPQTQT